MKLPLLFLVNICCIFCLTSRGGTYESELSAIVAAQSVRFQDAGIRKVAVIEFTDPEGNRSDFGRFLSEEISLDLTKLATGSKAFSVHSGFRLPKSLKHAGETEATTSADRFAKIPGLAQLDAIILGKYVVGQDVVTLSVRVIALKTGELIAFDRKQFEKGKDIAALIARGTDASDQQDYPQTPGAYLSLADEWIPLLKAEKRIVNRPAREVTLDIQASPKETVLAAQTVLLRTGEAPVISGVNAAFAVRIDPTNLTPARIESLQSDQTARIIRLPPCIDNQWTFQDYSVSPSTRVPGLRTVMASAEYKGDGLALLKPQQTLEAGDYALAGSQAWYIFRVVNTNLAGDPKTELHPNSLNTAGIPNLLGLYIKDGAGWVRLPEAKEKLLKERKMTGFVYDPNDPNPPAVVTASYTCGRAVPVVGGANAAIAVQAKWQDLTKLFKTEHENYVVFHLKTAGQHEWKAELLYNPKSGQFEYDWQNVFGIGRRTVISELKELEEDLHLIEFPKKLSSGYYGICVDGGFYLFQIRD